MGDIKNNIKTTKQQLEDNYILKNHTIDNLKSLGFRRYSPMCDSESSYYIYRFPVNKYLGTTTLECELKVDSNTGDIRIDVYDMDHDLFAMFYYNEHINFYEGLMSRINKVILYELKKLGIEKKNTEGENK